MAAMEYFFREINEELQSLTKQSVAELTNMWRRLYVPAMCEENLKKLLINTKSYYHHLIMESQRKTASIEQELADLQDEAETLCRLLNTSVNLPPRSVDTPLLQVQDEMDKSLTKLREVVRQRREEICELVLKQESLCEELGEETRPLTTDPLPTAMELDEFRSYLEVLTEQRSERVGEMLKLRKQITKFLKNLQINVSSKWEHHILYDKKIKVDKETFSGLQRMCKHYGEQVNKIKINSIRKRVETLWDRLNTSPNTRNKLQRHKDVTEYTYDMYYCELQRCEALYSQNIKHHVEQLRAEIIEFWDKTLKSENQRKLFDEFHSCHYSDEIKKLHEMELKKLKHFFNKNKEIFDLLESRKKIKIIKSKLDTKANDPARYNNRGGHLLREEKERNTIATKLSKIESQIRDLVQAYEKREQKAFLVYGEDINIVMDNELAKEQEEREKMSSARKKNQINTVDRLAWRKSPSPSPSSASAKKSRRSLLDAMRPTSSTQKNVAKSVATKPKVIGTIIRRKSGRHSTSNGTQAKKRRSNVQIVPKIIIEYGSDNYTDVDDESDWDGAAAAITAEEELYDTFEKCFDGNNNNNNKRAKRMVHIPTTKSIPENMKRTTRLGTARTRTPSPTGASSHHTLRSGYESSTSNRTAATIHQSPIGPGSSRKLRKTKDLPIIM